MFDSPRRRRRRRMIWPVLITVLIAGGVLVATSGSDARATITYLEDVRTASADLSRVGAAVRQLVGELSRADRTEFDSVMTGVETALANAQEVAAREPPSQELVGAGILFRLAVDSWTRGMEGFREALLLAADEPADTSAVDEVASAVVLVRAGDGIYDELVVELSRPDIPSPVADMPEVRLLPVDAPVTVLAPAWVEAVRSLTSGLALRPSIRIEQVATRPEWVTSATGDVVVPATSEIEVVIVVSNAGNTTSEPATLALTVGTPEADTAEWSAEVPGIAAGSQTAITLPGVEVVPGLSYILDVVLTPGGADMFRDDNRMSLRFTVNAETETEDEG